MLENMCVFYDARSDISWSISNAFYFFIQKALGLIFMFGLISVAGQLSEDRVWLCSYLINISTFSPIIKRSDLAQFCQEVKGFSKS